MYNRRYESPFLKTTAFWITTEFVNVTPLSLTHRNQGGAGLMIATPSTTVGETCLIMSENSLAGNKC